MDTFRNRLAEAMNIRGITQTELSRRTGISKPRINQYVKGIYEAKQDSVKLIAQTLNVNIPWLMGFDVPIDPPTTREKDLTERENRLLTYYRSLNDTGKERAMDNLEDLTKIRDYKEDNDDETM